MTTGENHALASELLAALAYFDVFDYPLTLAELRRYRWSTSRKDYPVSGTSQVPNTGRSSCAETAGSVVAVSDTGSRGITEARTSLSEPSLTAVGEALRTLPVGVKDGFYFLAGREAVVARRLEGYRVAEGKYRLARRFASWLRWLPSVRLVAVCNSLALSHAAADSDIDLLLVVRPRTVWVTRLLVVGVLAALGLRPDARTQRDRFCLSFMASESALDFSGLLLADSDPHFHYWLLSMMPLYDAGGVMTKILHENRWTRNRLPGVTAPRAGARRLKMPRGTAWLLPLLRRWDAAAGRLQLRLFPPAIRRLMNHDTRVVVSDDLLKLHVNDRREHYNRLFAAR